MIIDHIHDTTKYSKNLEMLMDVSKYQFNDDEIAKLHKCRDNQTDVRLRVRFMSLLMLSEGVELKTIASIIGKSVKTIENWHCQYKKKESIA